MAAIQIPPTNLPNSNDPRREARDGPDFDLLETSAMMPPRQERALGHVDELGFMSPIKAEARKRRSP